MAYLRPGVYVEETLNVIPPVAAQNAESIAAFTGAINRGPVEPTLITSWSQYTSTFGAWDATNNAVTTGVYLFFANGGSRAYIKRVAANDAAAATRTFLDRSGEDNATLTVNAKSVGAWGNAIYVTISDSVVTGAFDVTVYYGGTGAGNVVERFADLSMVTTDARYAPTIINAGSAYLSVVDAGSPETTAALRNPATVSLQPLASGANGAAIDSAAIANSIGAFDTITQSLILNAPGVTEAASVNLLISYAENRGDVFLVVDPIDDTVANQMSRAASYTASSHAAVYYPTLVIPNPQSSVPGATVKAPTGAAIVGKYVSTDASRGVFKAPAGLTTRVAGAVSVAKITNAELDAMNSAAAPVNALRYIPGSGIVVMGARTLKAGYVDKYVPVRRTLIYLRKALTDLTQFAIFEPNDERLWRLIDTTVSTFLTDFWQQGGLRGALPADAFFVKVDAENNPQITIDNGEVHIEVGVALQRPAEFVIIKIGQYDGGTTVTVA